MIFCLLQPWPKRRPALGATPLLVALLLLLLQVATPFAHAMLHAARGQAAAVQALSHRGPAWMVSDTPAAEEKPCALCAADHLPALPETAGAATPVLATWTRAAALPVLTLSSAPLDLFCRPPPSL